MPDTVVVRCGLRAGLEVDRLLARSLARELRRARALRDAGNALRARPLSEQRLREQLRRRGARPESEEAAVSTLAAAGLLDDARLAEARAQALADRGWGNAGIAARLVAEGIAAALVDAGLAELEPESARAERLVAGSADPRRAWALLARRGFDPDTIEGALGVLDGESSAG